MVSRVEMFLTDQARNRGAARALHDNFGTRWSYADLDAASDALADELRRAGVRLNDRVLMLSENCASAVATLFAVWKLGAVIVPVNARQTEAEVGRIVQHADPAAIVLTTAASEDALRHAETLGAREIAGRFGTLQLSMRGSSPDAALHDVAVLLYTTGTTGDPKGVMLTHGNMRFGGMTSAQLRGMTQDDLVYGALPITHVFGLASVVTACCFAGAEVKLEARFSAEKLFHALRSGVTMLSAVPQMHALLMQFAKEQGLTHLGSETLRYVSSGAAPLDPAWKRKAEAFYGVAVQNGYGMTETTAGICATMNDIGLADISVGPALRGVEVCIDADAQGEGEILTRGPHVMKGYFSNADATAAVLDAAGWMRTGDLGKMDAGGNLHILGRSKELIIHGGFNVYPPEVEAALNDHPQVVQSAVIGRKVDGDEQVYAFVQIAEDDVPELADLQGFVAARLAGYKRPSRIILAHALPAAPTGKILKHKLLAVFRDELD